MVIIFNRSYRSMLLIVHSQQIKKFESFSTIKYPTSEMIIHGCDFSNEVYLLTPKEKQCGSWVKILSIFDTPDEWTGTIWARTGCVRDDHENFSCATGDCKTNDIYCFNLTAKYPVTLINFSIKQSEATYDVSLVHGYNVPVKIVPDGGSGDCVTTGCPNDVMNVCPAQLIFAGSNGTAIACHGPCDVPKDADACKSNHYV
ncbi:hypothetical protein C5167_028716 [Papaver somniferum]|nr:hypothetical protein C5167_028716 [Papaver somniferum]